MRIELVNKYLNEYLIEHFMREFNLFDTKKCGFISESSAKLYTKLNGRIEPRLPLLIISHLSVPDKTDDLTSND